MQSILHKQIITGQHFQRHQLKKNPICLTKISLADLEAHWHMAQVRNILIVFAIKVFSGSKISDICIWASVRVNGAWCDGDGKW